MLRLPPLSALLGLVLALVLAGPAGGRSSAEPPAALFVFPYDSTPGAAAEHDIDLTLPDSSTLAIAAVTNYVPPGYTVALATAPGTVIGSATIFVSGQDAPISADLLTTDPAASAADPKAQACAAGAHAAVWKAALTVDGAAFPLSVFVDPTTADETARGSFKLAYCLPSPSVTADQGGSPGGARVVDVDLDLRSVVTNAPAAARLTWRAFVTPYQPGTATPLPGGAFEVRSIVALPHVLTFRSSFSARLDVLTLSGRIVSAGSPRPGINVHFATGSTLEDVNDLGVAQTQADGSYSFRTAFKRRKKVQKLILIAFVHFYVGDCAEPPLLPGGCAYESVAPPPARFATATIPKLAPKAKPKAARKKQQPARRLALRH